MADGTERFDRAVLDLPEPWAPLEALARVLEPGGVLVAYLPTVMQVQQLVLALPEHGFHHVETFETLKRGWHVTSTERSTRPPHGGPHRVPFRGTPPGLRPAHRRSSLVRGDA